MTGTVSHGEPILRAGGREIGLLVAHEAVSIIRACYPAGVTVAGPHVHDEHADTFYVIEGELTFVVGSEQRAVTVSVGALVVVPPGVVHSFRATGERPARWLT